MERFMKCSALIVFVILISLSFIPSISFAEDVRCKVDCSYCDYGCSVEEGREKHKEDFCERNPSHSSCKQDGGTNREPGETFKGQDRRQYIKRCGYSNTKCQDVPID